MLATNRLLLERNLTLELVQRPACCRTVSIALLYILSNITFSFNPFLLSNRKAKFRHALYCSSIDELTRREGRITLILSQEYRVGLERGHECTYDMFDMPHHENLIRSSGKRKRSGSATICAAMIWEPTTRHECNPLFFFSYEKRVCHFCALRYDNSLGSAVWWYSLQLQDSSLDTRACTTRN